MQIATNEWLCWSMHCKRKAAIADIPRTQYIFDDNSDADGGDDVFLCGLRDFVTRLQIDRVMNRLHCCSQVHSASAQFICER